MPLSITVRPPGKRLDLVFSGNLDISASIPVCELCSHIRPGVLLCTLDLRQVERVFDSGIALLQMLCERVRRLGGRVVLLGNHPEISRFLSERPPPRMA